MIASISLMNHSIKKTAERGFLAWPENPRLHGLWPIGEFSGINFCLSARLHRCGAFLRPYILKCKMRGHTFFRILSEVFFDEAPFTVGVLQMCQFLKDLFLIQNVHLRYSSSLIVLSTMVCSSIFLRAGPLPYCLYG